MLKFIRAIYLTQVKLLDNVHYEVNEIVIRKLLLHILRKDVGL